MTCNTYFIHTTGEGVWQGYVTTKYVTDFVLLVPCFLLFLKFADKNTTRLCQLLPTTLRKTLICEHYVYPSATAYCGTVRYYEISNCKWKKTSIILTVFVNISRRKRRALLYSYVHTVIKTTVIKIRAWILMSKKHRKMLLNKTDFYGHK